MVGLESQVQLDSSGEAEALQTPNSNCTGFHHSWLWLSFFLWDLSCRFERRQVREQERVGSDDCVTQTTLWGDSLSVIAPFIPEREGDIKAGDSRWGST